MLRWTLLGLVLALAAARAAERAPAPREVRFDRYGDQLPDGAAARLGTIRFRDPFASQLVFTPDGKSVVTLSSAGRVCFRAAATGQERYTTEFPLADPENILRTELDGSTWLRNLWDVYLGPDGQTVARLDGDHLIVRNLAAGTIRCTPLEFERTGSAGGGVPRLGGGLGDLRGLSPSRSVTFTATGQPVVFAKQHLFGGFEPGQPATLWDTTTGRLRVLGAASGGPLRYVVDMAASPDGKRVAGAAHLAGLTCWDTSGPAAKELWHLRDARADRLWFSPDSQRLLTDAGGSLCLRDAQSGQPCAPEIRSLPHDPVAFSPDGKQIAVGGQRTTSIWCTQGRLVRELPAGADLLAFSPDGRSLVTLGGVLERWDLATGRRLYADSTKWGHYRPVNHLVWSPDGRSLLSVSNQGGDIFFWDVTSRRPRGQAAWPGSRFVQAAFATGEAVAVDNRGELWAWTLTGQQTRHAQLDQGGSQLELHSAVQTPGGTIAGTLVPGGVTVPDGDYPETVLAVWDAQTGRQRTARTCVAERKSDRQWRLHDGRSVLVASGKRQRFDDGRPLPPVELDVEKEQLEWPAALSQDGRLLAAVVHSSKGDGPTVRVGVWEAANGRPVRSFPVTAEASLLGFTPDGFGVLVVGWEFNAFDLFSGARYHHIPSLAYPQSRAVAPDGYTLATGHHDGTILLWDLPRPPRQKAPIQPEERDALWTTLADPDPAKAFQAMGRLLEDPPAAVALFGERLRPAEALSVERVAALIRGLDAEAFRTRETATRHLAALGCRVESALQAALKAGASAEQRRRLTDLLTALRQGTVPPGEELRCVRAVQLLEVFHSAEARRLLERLAAGAPDDRLTIEARETLSRWPK